MGSEMPQASSADGLLGDARRLLQLEEAARQRLGAPRLSSTLRVGVVEEVAGGSLLSARRKPAMIALSRCGVTARPASAAARTPVRLGLV